MLEDSQVRILSPKKRRAIAALLGARTLEEAAQQANVSKRSLYDWLESDVEFRTTLQREQAAIVDSAARRLTTGQDRALQALESMLDDTTIPPGVRARVCVDWLSMFWKYRESLGLEQRLERIEKELGL